MHVHYIKMKVDWKPISPSPRIHLRSSDNVLYLPSDRKSAPFSAYIAPFRNAARPFPEGHNRTPPPHKGRTSPIRIPDAAWSKSAPCSSSEHSAQYRKCRRLLLIDKIIIGRKHHTFISVIGKNSPSEVPRASSISSSVAIDGDVRFLSTWERKPFVSSLRFASSSRSADSLSWAA